MKSKFWICILFISVFSYCLNTNAQSQEINRKYITLTRIIWQSDSTGSLIKNAKALLTEGIHQVDLYGRNYYELMNTDSVVASIILDFGKEIQGGIQIVTAKFPGKEPIKVRIRFGESVSETMAEIGEHGATNNHAIGDFTTILPWMGKTDLGSTGFRFGRKGFGTGV